VGHYLPCYLALFLALWTCLFEGAIKRMRQVTKAGTGESKLLKTGSGMEIIMCIQIWICLVLQHKLT
jgi:hypothetical protein